MLMSLCKNPILSIDNHPVDICDVVTPVTIPARTEHSVPKGNEQIPWGLRVCQRLADRFVRVGLQTAALGMGGGSTI